MLAYNVVFRTKRVALALPVLEIMPGRAKHAAHESSSWFWSLTWLACFTFKDKPKAKAKLHSDRQNQEYDCKNSDY